MLANVAMRAATALGRLLERMCSTSLHIPTFLCAPFLLPCPILMFSFSGALLIAGALGASAAPVVDVASAPALFKRNVTTGPVIDHDFPDPSIILLNQTWYAYSTSAGGKNVPVASSTDFNTTWTIVGEIPESPAGCIH